jgi:hypothetical protein
MAAGSPKRVISSVRAIININMRTNKFAKNTEEFDRRFDAGEDIHDLIDMTKDMVT